MRVFEKVILVLTIVQSPILLTGQNVNGLSFGSDETFDIATWNIEWFPKNGSTTLNYVAEIIQDADLDLVAIQEINEPDQFQNLLDLLVGYDGFFVENDYARLGYIYKTEGVNILAAYAIYTGQAYENPFPRPPYVLEMEFMGSEFIVINNHFKCCGDGFLDQNDYWDEENRREAASNVLKSWMDVNFPEANIILLGDLNDVIIDPPSNNVFQSFLNNPEAYVFVDMAIALGSSSNWSYPTWPSHLDHILISNELFDEMESESSEVAVLKVDNFLDNGWNEYESNVSDHRPVAIKFTPSSTLSSSLSGKNDDFRIFPNPATEYFTILLNEAEMSSEIELMDMSGKKVSAWEIPPGQRQFSAPIPTLPAGLYMILRTRNGEILQKGKISIKR